VTLEGVCGVLYNAGRPSRRRDAVVGLLADTVDARWARGETKLQDATMTTATASATLAAPQSHYHALKAKIADGSAVGAVCGLGYVGLPLMRAAAASGFRVIGFDIDARKVELLNAGRSYFRHIPSDTIAPLAAAGRFAATGDFSRIAEADVVSICVPTPLDPHREPDLSYVVQTTRNIAAYARPGQLIVLESTTYPGTTVEVLTPIFAERGLQPGRDVFLAFSPEREDPGNPDFETSTIPKIVGGDGADALDLAVSYYGRFVKQVVPVSSSSAAEAVKLTENIFRAVNIALVNELKVIFSKMGIDIWEVIDAAKTKPFGFMPFYPGPGLGGHCIPIDPFYLTWKAREYEISTRLIELAGEINTAMPGHVVARLAEELDRRFRKGLNGSRILIVGLAYKKNVDDIRESPALKLMELLERRGAAVGYYDPYVPEVPQTREHGEFAHRRTVMFDAATLASFDAALIATDHDAVDYRLLTECSKLVIDTRNVCARNGIVGQNIAKA
jgi:UDP-N-acetyl-D-glucosamine dehydrogenase